MSAWAVNPRMQSYCRLLFCFALFSTHRSLSPLSPSPLPLGFTGIIKIYVFRVCILLSSAAPSASPPLLMHQTDPIFSPFLLSISPFLHACHFTFSHKRRIIYKAGAQAICMATVATCRWPILSRVASQPCPTLGWKMPNLLPSARLQQASVFPFY